MYLAVCGSGHAQLTSLVHALALYALTSMVMCRKSGLPGPIALTLTKVGQPQPRVFETLKVQSASAVHAIPLHTADGQWLGNFVRPGEPAAAADRAFAELIPEQREALMKSYLDLDLDDVLDDRELDAVRTAGGPTPR